MVEIFSSDVAVVCESIQRTLDDFNGLLIKDLTPTSNKLWEYKVLQKYKYDDGNPFAILSRRYYRVTGILNFCVEFDVEWYKKATKSQFNLISTLTLNIKNLQLNTPIFMYFYTFDNKLDVEDSHTLKKGLKVNYTDCIIRGPAERYYIKKCNVFNDCVFIGMN